MAHHLPSKENSQSEWEKAKRRKFPIKEWEKAKKKENSRSNIGRKQKKYAERSLGQTISEQY